MRSTFKNETEKYREQLRKVRITIPSSRWVMDAYEDYKPCPECKTKTLGVYRLTGDHQEFVCRKCKKRFYLDLRSGSICRIEKKEIL